MSKAMFFNTNICILVILKLVLASDEDDQKTVLIGSEEIVDSFKNIVTSEYIRNLANEFAAKAAKHFINEMKHREAQLREDYTKQRNESRKGIKPGNSKLRRDVVNKQNPAQIDDTPRLKFVKLRENWGLNKPAATTRVPELREIEVTTQVFETHEAQTDSTDKPDHEKYDHEKYDHEKYDHEAPSILNEEQAMTLLKEPSPDGDNLEEDPKLTDEEEENPLAALGPMKINGVYFRRLLGAIELE